VYQRLQAVVPKGMVDVEDLCLQLRCIKEPAEIDLYRQGGQVVAAEAKAAVEAIRPGVSEYEITLAAKAAGTRAAAQFLGPDERLFSPLVRGLQMLTAGVDRADWVHGRTSTHRLAKDDVVYMCFCEITSFRGYELGFDRTARVETLSPEQRRMLNTVLAAQDAAFSKARAGEIAANLDAAANAVLEKAGLLQYRLHRTGRGVGVAPVEPPIITSSDEQTVLRSGMVLCISPGVYVPGVGNAHIGDTILITDSGFERLTPFPGNLWD
jgi:Xaa-Pro dipeptidase